MGLEQGLLDCIVQGSPIRKVSIMVQDKVTNSAIVIQNWTDQSGMRWRLVIEVATIRGRNEPVALSITAVEAGYALSQSTVRAIPFASFLRNDKSVIHQRIDPSGPTGSMRAMSPTPPKREGRRYTDYELQRVAIIYRDAYKARVPVQRAVADALEIPLSTAVKRIIAARKRGFIDAMPRVSNRDLPTRTKVVFDEYPASRRRSNDAS